MAKTLWEEREKRAKDPEETTIIIMNNVDYTEKHMDTLKDIGSFAKHAQDKPDKPAPNDGSQNKKRF